MKQQPLFLCLQFSLGLALACVLTCEMVSAAGANTGWPQSGSRIIAAQAVLPGGSRDLGRAPSALPVRIALTLTYQHDAELQQLINLQSDPRSAYYHHYLSNAQFADYFAPRAVDEQHVVDALNRAGFAIAQRNSNRTVVDAVAPAATAERYFSTEIHQFSQPGAAPRYANVRPAYLPAELDSVVATVVGLSNVVRRHPDLMGATPAQKLRARERALAMSDGNGARLVGTRITAWQPVFHEPVTAASANVLTDGGFESGGFGAWLPATALPDAVIESVHAHSGKYAAFFGSKTTASGEIDGDAGIVQGVTIPVGGVLSFWVLAGSNERNPKTSWQEADLLDYSGRRIVNFYATAASTLGWKHYSFSVAASAGRRFYLYFGVHGNGDSHHRTFQFIDDVQLTGSGYPATGAPIGGPLTGPDGGYGPVIVANGYDLPVQHHYDGAGRATGIAISGDYSNADLSGYLYEFGITRGGTTTRVAVDGGAHYDPTTPDTEEATLDVETIVGLAPSTHVYMYLIPDLGDVSIVDDYNRAVADNAVDVVNSSFGGCEVGDQGFNLAVNRIAAQGAAKGITFAAASGDQGSEACSTDFFGFLEPALGVNTPASIPNFVAVGGTTLFTNDDGSYNSEWGWDDSTGGVSVVWNKPAYQVKFPKISGSTRNVPDIAFPADPEFGSSYYLAGEWQGPIGGTSWSSPIFCALQTEIDQRRNTRFGYVNPLIYSAFLKNGGYALFHDITIGSNGDYNAGPGYDLVTGIGSIRDGYRFSTDE